MGGQYNGFCVQHSESITISQYFETEDGSFRPSVYYVYQPCDAAITSIHEMRGKELGFQNKYRVIKKEIISGIDELGVLLIGDDFCWWHGSQMSIDDARKLIPGESATSVQVAGSMLAAIVWMIENPKMGYIEPEYMPFEQILEIADMYWAPLASVGCNWTPNKDVNSLFYKPYDESNPCKFENFRVWT
jgi:homospermidine synthase